MGFHRHVENSGKRVTFLYDMGSRKARSKSSIAT